MVKKRWQDLTVVEKIGVALMGTVQLLLLVTALWDISRQPADENGNTPPRPAPVRLVQVEGRPDKVVQLTR